MFKQSNLQFRGWDNSAHWAELFHNAEVLFDEAHDAEDAREAYLAAYDFWDFGCQELRADTRYSPEEKYTIKQVCLNHILEEHGARLGDNFRKRLHIRAYSVAKHLPAADFLLDSGFLAGGFPPSVEIENHLAEIASFFKNKTEHTHHEKEEAMMAAAEETPMASMEVPVDEAAEIPVADVEPVVDSSISCPIFSGSYKRTFEVPADSDIDGIQALFDSFLADNSFDFQTIVLGEFAEHTMRGSCDNRMRKNFVRAQGRALHIKQDKNLIPKIITWLNNNNLPASENAFIFINKQNKPVYSLNKNEVNIVKVNQMIGKTVHS